MAKEELTPFDLTEKVTLYAPKGAKYHAERQEVKVHPRQKEKFLAKGFTETKPANAIPADQVRTFPDGNNPTVMTEAGNQGAAEATGLGTAKEVKK